MMLTNAAEIRPKTPAIIGFSCSCGRRFNDKKNGFQGFGLKSKRLSNMHVKHSARACNLKANSAIILPSLPMKGCRRGNLLNRRIIAASRFCRGGFYFGLDDSCVVPLTAATREPLRRAVSYLAVSNLREAAYPVERVDGSKNLNRNRVMCTNFKGGNPSESLSPELVQAFLECRLSSDVSPELIARIKAASDAVYSVAYKAVVNADQSCPEIKKAGSTLEDFRVFISGVVRAAISAKTAYNWDNASGDKGADHE